MKKIFIITGEPSGDKHAADVAKELLKEMPNLSIEAVGGINLQAAGVKLFCNHDKMSAVGLSPKILFNHILLGKKVAHYLIKEYKPDLVLLVDYGGFNLNIAKILKKAGLKIFYYIPPQIWASRKWRIKTVKKYIDKVITIYPFEIEMYKRENINAVFSGNPLVSQLPQINDKKKFFNEFGLDLNKKLVSIFPGSRNFEVNNLLTIFIEASKIIQQEIPDIQFAICQSCAINDNLIKPFVPENIKIIKGKNYELLALSDALILASGTVALEAALYSTPMIISYKGPALFYFIYLMVRCIDKVSLPNIILNKNVIPELIQNKAKPEIIAKHIILLLKDKNKYEEIKNELKNVKHFLTEKKSYLETAKIILSEIQ